jgi:hypothetical protein
VPDKTPSGRRLHHQGARDVPAGRNRAGVVGSVQYRIGCHTRTVVIVMRDAVPDQEAKRPRRRRLSDHVMVAFHIACDEGNLEAARQLLTIVEFMLRRPPRDGRPERRIQADPLVAAHERLWSLRHPEARDG